MFDMIQNGSAALRLYRALSAWMAGRLDQGQATRWGWPSDWRDALCWVQLLATAPGAQQKPSVRVGLLSNASSAPLSLCAPCGAAVDVSSFYVNSMVNTDPFAAGQAQALFKPENLFNSTGQGTLGAVLRANDGSQRLFAATAGHVLAGHPDARLGDGCLVQQTWGDVRLPGVLFDWEPDLRRGDRSASIDASLMQIDVSALETAAPYMDWPAGWATPSAGDELMLLARHHRMPARYVGPISTTVSSGNERYFLNEVMCIEVDAQTLGGDSGAPLWDMQQRLVGMHIGLAPPGSIGNALASPIGAVLQRFQCEVVQRFEALQGEARSVPMAVRQPDPVVAPHQETAQAADTLARTMWGEARGEPGGGAGMAAVAHVVLNRRDMNRWWGRSIESVCLKASQFSCWNEADPNRTKMLELTGGDTIFVQALDIAQKLMAMAIADRAAIDPTSGATHYHASNIALPGWTAKATSCGRIGNHLFYKNIA